MNQTDNVSLLMRGLLSVNDLWCKPQGHTAKRRQALSMLNRRMWTRVVGGVGAIVRSRCLPD